MSSIRKSSIHNSEAASERNDIDGDARSTLISSTLTYTDDRQSSSVRVNEDLWQNSLAQLFSENIEEEPFSIIKALYKDTLREKKRRELIQLLRSWREDSEEEDEQEENSTMEDLKKALDEDRTSYRKLFP